MNTANRRMTSVFFQRGDALEYIRAGATFRKTRSDRITETAEIKSVYADPLGVPHVKFDLVMEKPFWPTYSDGSRILSLKSFFDKFEERVIR